VSGLLSTEDRLPLVHGLQHVSIADLGRDDLDPRVAMDRMKPRFAITVVTTSPFFSFPRLLPVPGQDGHDAVAVDDATLLVGGDEPVGVTVEREADAPDAALATVSGCVAPKPSLMLSPVGSAPMTDTSAFSISNSAGAAWNAAPWAQSRVTSMPVNEYEASRARHPTYWSRAS
jgi:hypothetical protein